MLGDYIVYSHDLSDCESIDITKRNWTLITIGALREVQVISRSYKVKSNCSTQAGTDFMA